MQFRNVLALALACVPAVECSRSQGLRALSPPANLLTTAVATLATTMGGMATFAHAQEEADAEIDVKAESEEDEDDDDDARLEPRGDEFDKKWDVDKLPQCARECLFSSWGASGCKAPFNVACMCRSKKFKDAAVPCVRKKCNMGDALRTKKWAETVCKKITS